MLWLKFKDEDGTDQRVEVDRDAFTIGRHSSCELTYLDGRLSREHLRFERENGGFRVAELGSSNGTTLNGSPLASPTVLRDGDLLDLGGGLQITVELLPGDAAGTSAGSLDPAAGSIALQNDVTGSVSVPQAGSPIGVPSQPAGAEGFPIAFFVIAPLLGLFVIIAVIGAFVLLGGSGNNDQVDYDDDPGYGRGNRNETMPDDEDEDPTRGTGLPINTSDAGNGRTLPPATPANTGPGTGGALTESAKVEKFAPPFLKEIALNDPRAFLTGEQALKVNDRIKQLKGTQSLADNIVSARKNSAAIKSLAASKNLKPQFLAVAAVTKLGSGRGDVLQAAKDVADVYGKLSIQIGMTDFDSALLVVAAFEQGSNGETMKMRNLLQEAAAVDGAPPARTVRSIWYLEKIGKISRSDYDRALNFLAIGVISQNPKEFGVNAEALTL